MAKSWRHSHEIDLVTQWYGYRWTWPMIWVSFESSRPDLVKKSQNLEKSTFKKNWDSAKLLRHIIYRYTKWRHQNKSGQTSISNESKSNQKILSEFSRKGHLLHRFRRVDSNGGISNGTPCRPMVPLMINTYSVGFSFRFKDSFFSLLYASSTWPRTLTPEMSIRPIS